MTLRVDDLVKAGKHVSDPAMNLFSGFWPTHTALNGRSDLDSAMFNSERYCLQFVFSQSLKACCQSRAIKYPGLGVRSVGPVGDFLDI